MSKYIRKSIVQHHHFFLVKSLFIYKLIIQKEDSQSMNLSH